MKNYKTIVIIPARGGSKGIPRKNIRPLNGKPLIYYSIKASLSAKKVDRVVVSTEDEEIELFSNRFGAEVLKRPDHLSDDEVPLDPVILHAVEICEKRWNERYDCVVTVQPTSPLLTSGDIDCVIEKLKNDSLETVISVCEDKHLRWKDDHGRILPDYDERVNRQLLPDVYKETGAIIACKREVLISNTRIGKEVALYYMDPMRSIDIDSYNDLWLCELILKRKKIVIAVTGNSTIGMGHVYRTLLLAHELIHHEIVFVCKETDDLAIDYISKHNYRVEVAKPDLFPDKIMSFNPDMVINDILDTSADYVMSLKKKGPCVISFEDMGMGAEAADLVINALYPHHIPQSHIMVGHKYFCLRDEFIHIKKRDRNGPVRKILISFGGVDEGNLTCRILRILEKITKDAGIKFDVVLGPGYIHHKELNNLAQELNTPLINIVSSTNKISEYMNNADLAITSAGRTVFELASFAVPTVVISQNLRETKHTFASSKNGFINMGLRSEIDDETIKSTLLRVLNDENLRKTMIDKMNSFDLRSGKKRVIEQINAFLK